jgi:guanosine-3',5'-bis(diphosphate) 3'-pyrophosphohydrolase
MTASTGAFRAVGLRVDVPERHDRRSLSRWLHGLMTTSSDPVTDLVQAHREIHPRGDGALIRRAYLTAEQMHQGQMRKSGEPFITHPLAVARILADLGMDTITLVAALLHDTVEDTSYTLGALQSDFGSEVALLVDGVTKLDRAFFGEHAEVETIRKMLVKSGKDERVLIIKLADRLHNMRTLGVRSQASRERIARATMDVLVPLCDRLGIQALKRGLEDTVLAALEPDAYAAVEAHVNNRPEWNRVLNWTIDQVRKKLAESRIDAWVRARPRHYYSIWRETIAENKPMNFDLPRVVVVVDGPRTDCYTALGSLHSMWRPVPGRFKDFIASPKNNLYRSLHTTVIGPAGQPVEVLIRTVEMHHAAEFGIAANFRDPQAAARLDAATRAEQLAWLRRVLAWQDDVDDAHKFLDALRCDLAYAQIQVFTLDGQAVLLPVDATPVDLAYTLGADTGNSCVGAARNSRLIPLSSVLNDGDVIDIITREPDREPPGPSREWLDFVKSPQARLEITRWFQTRYLPPVSVAHRVRLGQAAIGLALREEGRSLANDAPLRILAEQLDYPDVDALLVAVADHRVSAHDVVARLIAMVDGAQPRRGY